MSRVERCGALYGGPYFYQTSPINPIISSNILDTLTVYHVLCNLLYFPRRGICMADRENKVTWEEIGRQIGRGIDQLLMDKDSNLGVYLGYIEYLFWGVVLFIAFAGSSMIIKWIGFKGPLSQLIRTVLEALGAFGFIFLILVGLIKFLLKLWWDLKDCCSKFKKRGNSK